MALTTERLREISNDGFLEHGDAKLMARELLANREAQPVVWGSPKTVGQLIGQLQTLDPAMETTALLRMPADILDGNAVKQVPISISFERLEGHWLAPYKGDGRKVLAFWAKADHREEADRGELFTAPPAPVVPDEITAPLGAIANGYQLSIAQAEGYRWGWNACRAAMLAQPVSRRYKLADSSGGWIEHDGDSIPKSLDRNALVYLKTRGKELKFPYPAGIVRWGHFNNDFDIVAYKMAAAPEGR